MNLTRVDFYVATKLPAKEKSTVKTFFLTNFFWKKRKQCYFVSIIVLREKNVLVIEIKLKFEAES